MEMLNTLAKYRGGRRKNTTVLEGVEYPSGPAHSFQFFGDGGGNHQSNNHRPHVRYGDKGFTHGPRDEDGKPI